MARRGVAGDESTPAPEIKGSGFVVKGQKSMSPENSRVYTIIGKKGKNI
jgi:hypothetical protein